MANGARWKSSIKKLLGDRAADGDVAVVSRDAARVFLATLRSLPSDAAPVRALVGLHARHVALAAYYGHRAAEAGLASPEGLRLDDVASRHSQRAERLAVTALDVATKLAKANAADVDPIDALRARMALVSVDK